jgi:hypothetical protein
LEVVIRSSKAFKSLPSWVFSVTASSLVRPSSLVTRARARRASSHIASKRPRALSTAGARAATALVKASRGRSATSLRGSKAAPAGSRWRSELLVWWRCIVVAAPWFGVDRVDEPIDGGDEDEAGELDRGGDRGDPVHHALLEVVLGALIEGDAEQGLDVERSPSIRHGGQGSVRAGAMAIGEPLGLRSWARRREIDR